MAILDNGTAETRTGAIVGLAPTSTAQAKPVREWNTLDVIAYGSKLTSRVNGVEVAWATVTRPAGSIGLENAGNNLMYADVRIKELATDTTAPTITIRNVPDGMRPAGHAVHRRLRVRRRAGPARVPATAIDTGRPAATRSRVTAKDAAGNELSSAAPTRSSPTPPPPARARRFPRRSR